MDSDIISYESMLAAKESANWAWWTMAASIATVLISLATLGIAYSALNSWKDQERLKIKLDFKKKLIEFEDSLTAMPDNWTSHDIRYAITRLNAQRAAVENRINDEVEIYFKREALSTSYRNATNSFVMYEMSFKDLYTSELWEEVRNEFSNYVIRGGSKVTLEDFIKQLHSRLSEL